MTAQGLEVGSQWVVVPIKEHVRRGRCREWGGSFHYSFIAYLLSSYMQRTSLGARDGTKVSVLMSVK